MKILKLLIGMLLCSTSSWAQVALNYIPPPAALFYSTDGSGGVGTWQPETSTGGTALPNIPPNIFGAYCSNDGSGHVGTWVPCGNNGSGGGGGVSIENTFSSAGSFTFAHHLNSIFNQVHCVTRTGTNTYAPATWTDFPVDANDTTVTVPSAGDYICSFNASGALPGTFSVAVVPTTQSWTISGSGTQQPTYTVNQSITGGYSGTVTYSVSGLASGMTGAFSPTTITGAGSNTLTLSFPSTQTPATTTFTVSGTDGTNTHSVNPVITVVGAALSAWPMNEGSGLTLNDVSGHGNTITLTGSAVTWQTNTGFPGTTPLWSGTGQGNATSGTLTNFTGTSPFWISTWVKMPFSAAEQTLFGTLDVSGTFRGFALETLDTSGISVPNFFLVGTYPSSAIVANGSTNIADGLIHYVVVSYDGTQTAAGVSIYVDAVKNTTTGTINTLTTTTANGLPVVIGARSNGTTEYPGVEAFTEIGAGTLSQATISANFALGPGIH